MENKKYFGFLILLLSVNISITYSFKYPINKDLLYSEKGESTSIEISTKSELDKYILNNKYVISIFHADWCGHCKRFLPVFNEASKYKIISNNWKLLKIPCTKYPSICNAFSIEGYPTIKIYKDSQEMKGISPPRDLENFLEFLIKISSDPLIKINSKQEFFDFFCTFSPLVEYKTKDNGLISCINNLANSNEFLSEYYFGLIPSGENRIVFDFDDNNLIFKYNDKNNCDDVKIFLNNNKYPLMSEANFNLFRKMNRDNKKYIFIIFYNSNNDIIDNFIKEKYKNISKENREIVFAFSQINQRKDLSNYFKIVLNKETELQIFIYNFHKEKFYKHEIYDINITNLDKIKEEIVNLVKNINKITYISDNKINDFISNNKITIIIISIILIACIIYLVCFLNIDDNFDEDSDEKENKEKGNKDRENKEKKKLINNEIKENKEKKDNEILKEQKIDKEKKD